MSSGQGHHGAFTLQGEAMGDVLLQPGEEFLGTVRCHSILQILVWSLERRVFIEVSGKTDILTKIV